MEDYKVIRSIGKGSFGKVYLVRHVKEHREYVMKVIKLKGIPPKERDACRNEVQLMQRLQHPNIVAYRDSFFANDRENLCIVMTYCDGGDLNGRITKSNGQLFNEDQIMQWFVQIALGMHFMHENRVLHRDIKAQNIFLLGNGRLVLGDLGISKVLDGTSQFASTQIGTPYYMSPELFGNKPYNHKSDVWAMGCVLYEMCTLKHPFDASNLQGLSSKIRAGVYAPINKSYSAQLVSLIASMLTVNPNSRPTVAEILQQPYCKKHIYSFIRDIAERSNGGLGKSSHCDVPVSEGTMMFRAAALGAAHIQQGASDAQSHVVAAGLGPHARNLDTQLSKLGLGEVAMKALKDAMAFVSTPSTELKPSFSLKDPVIGSSSGSASGIRAPGSSSAASMPVPPVPILQPAPIRPVSSSSHQSNSSNHSNNSNNSVSTSGSGAMPVPSQNQNMPPIASSAAKSTVPTVSSKMDPLTAGKMVEGFRAAVRREEDHQQHLLDRITEAENRKAMLEQQQRRLSAGLMRPSVGKVSSTGASASSVSSSRPQAGISALRNNPYSVNTSNPTGVNVNVGGNGGISTGRRSSGPLLSFGAPSNANLQGNPAISGLSVNGSNYSGLMPPPAVPSASRINSNPISNLLKSPTPLIKQNRPNVGLTTSTDSSSNTNQNGSSNSRSVSSSSNVVSMKSNATNVPTSAITASSASPASGSRATLSALRAASGPSATPAPAPIPVSAPAPSQSSVSSKKNPLPEKRKVDGGRQQALGSSPAILAALNPSALARNYPIIESTPSTSSNNNNKFDALGNAIAPSVALVNPIADLTITEHVDIVEEEEEVDPRYSNGIPESDDSADEVLLEQAKDESDGSEHDIEGTHPPPLAYPGSESVSAADSNIDYDFGSPGKVKSSLYRKSLALKRESESIASTEADLRAELMKSTARLEELKKSIEVVAAEAAKSGVSIPTTSLVSRRVSVTPGASSATSAVPMGAVRPLPVYGGSKIGSSGGSKFLVSKLSNVNSNSVSVSSTGSHAAQLPPSQYPPAAAPTIVDNRPIQPAKMTYAELMERLPPSSLAPAPNALHSYEPAPMPSVSKVTKSSDTSTVNVSQLSAQPPPSSSFMAPSLLNAAVNGGYKGSSQVVKARFGTTSTSTTTNSNNNNNSSSEIGTGVTNMVHEAGSRLPLIAPPLTPSKGMPSSFVSAAAGSIINANSATNMKPLVAKSVGQSIQPPLTPTAAMKNSVNSSMKHTPSRIPGSGSRRANFDPAVLGAAKAYVDSYDDTYEESINGDNDGYVGAAPSFGTPPLGNDDDDGEYEGDDDDDDASTTEAFTQYFDEEHYLENLDSLDMSLNSQRHLMVADGTAPLDAGDAAISEILDEDLGDSEAEEFAIVRHDELTVTEVDEEDEDDEDESGKEKQFDNEDTKVLVKTRSMRMAKDVPISSRYIDPSGKMSIGRASVDTDMLVDDFKSKLNIPQQSSIRKINVVSSSSNLLPFLDVSKDSQNELPQGRSVREKECKERLGERKFSLIYDAVARFSGDDSDADSTAGVPGGNLNSGVDELSVVDLVMSELNLSESERDDVDFIAGLYLSSDPCDGFTI